jgi:hypothetical protein
VGRVSEWISKPVNFKRNDPDEMALYEFAGSLPNFTVLVKQYLRVLSLGRVKIDLKTLEPVAIVRPPLNNVGSNAITVKLE